MNQVSMVKVDSSMRSIYTALSEKHKKQNKKILMKKIKTILTSASRIDLIETNLRIIKS